MKISKKILPITLILFIIFVSGCSKNFFGVDNGEPDSNLFGMASDLEKIEENSGEGATSSGSSENAGSGQNFGSAEQDMSDNGVSGSFSAEPFAGDRGDKAPDATSEFLTEENLREGDSSVAPDWKVSPGQSFGSAEQGMPGNGASGSFSAEPFAGDHPDATSEFLTEENLREGDPSFAPDWKVSPGQNFGSAEQGMPGNGASGSFSAEPFIDEKGEEMVASLPQDEQVRRLLPYHVSERLADIHFAFDKYDLDNKSRAILKENADYLKVHPASLIEVGGHCDERGSNSYNISLGERRAQATKSYLISLGVDESRIRTISYGEERPFCFESNEACWYQNRRAHFLVTESIESSATPSN